MKVSSTVKMNFGRIRQLTQAQIAALEQTAEALHTEVVQAEIMPRDSGGLQNEKTFVDDSKKEYGKVSLVSEGPYARRLYYHPEYNYQTYENAFAQGKWYSPWLPGGIYADFVPKTFKKFYIKETKI